MTIDKQIKDFQNSIIMDQTIAHPFAYLTGYYGALIKRVYEIGNEETQKHIEMALVKQ
jgi:hypothetical protein